MSGCDSIRKRLSAYLDDEVPAGERERIADHLVGCAACRTRREELARANQALASVPEPHWAPNSTDALVAKLRTQIARERPAAPPAHVIAARPPAGYNWRALALPLAAVFLVVAVPGLWLGTRHADAPRSEAVAQRVAPAAAASPVANGAPAAAPAKPAGPARAKLEADRDEAGLAANRRDRPVVDDLKDSHRALVAADPVAKQDQAAVFGRAVQSGALREVAQAAPKGAPAAPVAPPAEAQVLAAGKVAAPSASGAARGPVGGPGAVAMLDSGSARANRLGGAVAAEPAAAGPAQPSATRVPLAAAPVPAGSGALSGLDIEMAELERRMAAVEAGVSAFTTAAREQAHREANQVASRRYATWR